MQNVELSPSRHAVNTNVILSHPSNIQHIINPAHVDSSCPRTLPAKGSVGVDDAQGVEGGVHHLPGTQQVHHHRNAQAADQNAQRNVHHPTYQHT